MENKNQIIYYLISAGLIIIAFGVFYFLDFPKMKESEGKDKQIVQLEKSIESRKGYYQSLDAKVIELNGDGWEEKSKQIAVNFSMNDPFLTPKLNNFFETVVSGSGLSLNQMTYSTAAAVKGTPKATTGSDSMKVGGESAQPVAQSSSLDQLNGSAKKITYNLTVSGSYSAFKNFLKQLENQTRIATVQSISVSSGTPQVTGRGKTRTITNILDFNLIVDVYSY